MSVLQDIVEWNKSLPDWQSDAIARLFSKQSLSTQDVDDLLALVKQKYEIPDPQNRKAVRLQAAQIPAAPTAGDHIELIALKNLKHVNAIAENHRLPFATTGMTVIYGDNGSGKSGYARVLKRACRARDQSEAILPNATLSGVPAGKAQAAFEIKLNGVVREESWTDGTTAPDILSAISIFDGQCARAYLDNEDDFSYVPYGLDILENLAQTCKQLKTRLEAEQSQCTVNLDDFTDLRGTTAVGKIVGALSAQTDSAKIEALSTLTSEEQTAHDGLEKALKEADPKAKSEQLRVKVRRITRMKDASIQKLGLVNDEALGKLRNLDESYQTARKAADLAATAFKDDKTLLSGTGGVAWRELFDAARMFSTEVYAEKPFPHVHEGAQCLLCQQPLQDGAQRLIRFEAFVQQEAGRNADVKQAELSVAQKDFTALDLSITPDAETLDEIAALDKKLVDDAKAFAAVLKKRHADTIAALASHDWSAISALVSSPAERLNALTTTLTAEADGLEKAADATARAAMKTKFIELGARKLLGLRKTAVLEAVEKFKRKAKLANCVSAVKTNAISIKAGELAEKVVNADLVAALKNEFQRLGVTDLKVDLKSRSDKGNALHKLTLALPQAKNLLSILSEGEQRAIAIASFLAEIRLSKSTGGIIFDDPVSSLDHGRRELVARRLADEAQARQVIVFTHDIYFLCVLLEEAQRAGVFVSTQTLNRRPDGFGVSEDNLPFEGKTTADRVGYLKNLHQQIAKIHKNNDVPEYRRLTIEAYIFMRHTWEGATEEVLFQRAVIRFRKGVETQRLAGVVVEDADFDQIEKGVSKCSNYAHDKAAMGGVAIPHPDELLQDIEALEAWRKATHKRGETVAKLRKAKPQASGQG